MKRCFPPLSHSRVLMTSYPDHPEPTEACAAEKPGPGLNGGGWYWCRGIAFE